MHHSDSKSNNGGSDTAVLDRAQYAALPINSPKELASLIADHARNTLGTKVSTQNLGNKSTVAFKASAFTNKLASSPDELEKFVKDYKNSLADAGGYFGYITKVSSVQPEFVVSFTKTI